MVLAGALTFCAWYGPNQDISNLSRWAWLLGWRKPPEWFRERQVDRQATVGGTGVLVLLVVVAGAWLWQPGAGALPPAPVPAPTQPAPPPAVPAQPSRPDRLLDDAAKNTILVNVPKDKKVRVLVLAGEPERERFAD